MKAELTMLNQRLPSDDNLEAADGGLIMADHQLTGHALMKRSDYGSSVPMILIPKQSDKECIPSNQLSSIGFLGFIISVVNALISVANNLNSNNNNRNNNNNQNNDNNDNINIANLNSMQMNMNMVMAGRGLKDSPHWADLLASILEHGLKDLG